MNPVGVFICVIWDSLAHGHTPLLNGVWSLETRSETEGGRAFLRGGGEPLVLLTWYCACMGAGAGLVPRLAAPMTDRRRLVDLSLMWGRRTRSAACFRILLFAGRKS